MEEVLSGVFGQMGSKNPPRHFIASAEERGGGVVRIQMATALIMQLVQVSQEGSWQDYHSSRADRLQESLGSQLHILFVTPASTHREEGQHTLVISLSSARLPLSVQCKFSKISS
jgi:hypothetical protein